MTEDNSNSGWPFEELFEAIKAAARADDGTATKSTERVDVGVNVRTGLGPGVSGRKGHPSFGRSRSTATPDRPVQVDEDGETRRVTVDLTDMDPTQETVSAVASESEVRVNVDGDTVTTVSIDGDKSWSIEETTLNNGIYQICLR